MNTQLDALATVFSIDVPARSEPLWTFRFRGKSPGLFGGAVVVACERDEDLVAAVTICAANQRWNPARGIDKATARLNSIARNGRTNRWRFTKELSNVGNLAHQAYALAREALHHAFFLHSPTDETRDWFTRQLPWVVTGVGLEVGGKVRVG